MAEVSAPCDRERRPLTLCLPLLPQPKRELICPYESCLDTLSRSSELKAHVLLHMRCWRVLSFYTRLSLLTISCDGDDSWFRCPHCPRAFFYHVNAEAHVDVCASRKAGESPGEPRVCFDARYPLLRIWSLGMSLPAFKSDGSGDACMVIGEGQAWECAKDSRIARFVSATVEPIGSATAMQADGDTL